MAKIGKRTKKFQKKHLDGELRRRKAAKVKKQREATAARRARARGSESDEGDGTFRATRAMCGRRGREDGWETANARRL